MSCLLDTSVVIASLDGDEPNHAACDRLLAAARKAGVEALVTLDVRDFQGLTRPGDPIVRAP